MNVLRVCAFRLLHMCTHETLHPLSPWFHGPRFVIGSLGAGAVR